MRNYYEISADLVTSSDVRHVTRVPHSCEALSIPWHVTRVAGGGVTRLVTRVSSRAAAAWVRADSGQTIICYLLAPPVHQPGEVTFTSHRPA